MFGPNHSCSLTYTAGLLWPHLHEVNFEWEMFNHVLAAKIYFIISRNWFVTTALAATWWVTRCTLQPLEHQDLDVPREPMTDCASNSHFVQSNTEPYFKVFNYLSFRINGPPCLSICHQMAVHNRTTMLAHCNLKRNTWLCSKQSSFFPFMHCPLVANQRRDGPLTF